VSKRYTQALLIATCLLATTAAFAQSSPRTRASFDDGWTFALGDQPNADRPTFDDRQKAFRPIAVPHDWSIATGFDQNAPTGGAGGYVQAGIGWYRKEFKTPPEFTGKRVTLTFDGVYMNADVFVNGNKVTSQPYGYTTFSCDITDALASTGNANVVAVRVDNSVQPNSRWYTGSGIYRHTWITATAPVHVADSGTYVTTPLATAERARIDVRTTVANETNARAEATVEQQLLDEAGNAVAKTDPTSLALPQPNKDEPARREIVQSLDLAQPRRWSVDSPTLYTVRTMVRVNNEITDTYNTPIGIRSIDYDVEKGFLLNGQPTKMKGVCLHHDGGAVGAAVPIEIWERRLKLLKDMGCNAIRASHNPPAPEFLDLCDRMGFLVMDEAFDEWKSRKGQLRGSYATLFNDWWKKDLTAMLLRDRNHPSIVIWSVGNEIGEQRSSAGPAILKDLVDLCHALDPTRPVTAACDNAAATNPAPAAFMDAQDVAGYNYVDRWGDRRETYFAPDRIKYPQRRFIGTEDVSVGGIRGDYSRTIGTGPEARPAYTTTMIRAAELWKFNRMHDYVTGYFMWTGIDYLGEARWPNRSASSGVIDQAGFPKDGYYFYQSIWTSAPMVHAFPHWIWPGREGALIPVVVYSNCDTVELVLNGKSMGAKALAFPREGTKGGWNTYERPDRANPTTADLHLSWDVPYAPGTLKIVGRRQGQVVAEQELKTAGDPASIHLKLDRPTLTPSGVAHVEVALLDKDGTLVPDASTPLTFNLDGPASLLATDNGNPADHTLFTSKDRQAFHGRALALLKASTQAGKATLTVRAANLPPATVELDIRP
jgi:beta-galactosidase